MKALLNDGTVQEMEDGLSVLRHTTSHVLAQAVKRLYPETKLAIGPSVSDGFYYDMDREGGFTDEDLAKIEAETVVATTHNYVLDYVAAAFGYDGESELLSGITVKLDDIRSAAEFL